ncbi:F-box/WD repeat-containing protein 7-like [Lineus longissimus]|uniref:F-box/WD repeat-containing protein 7-like n=1 Tax=Lineus longissimus TaxID=88925 RepID=UPI002B4E7217
MGNTLASDGEFEGSKECLADALPKELIEKILSYLSHRELLMVARCSKIYRDITNQDIFWLSFCMRRRWLKYGLSYDLLNEQSPPYTPPVSASGKSPIYSFQEPEHSTLPPLCKWRKVFMRANHLQNNWKTGRYSIPPPLKGHTENVTCIDSNGQVIVSGSADKTLRIWDIHTCRCIHKIGSHSDAVTAVKIKGNVIVTGCADCSIRVFDSTTGKLTLTFQGHAGSVDHLAVDGDTIVSASADRRIRVWSLKLGKLTHSFRGHDDDIECLALHGTHALTGSWDSTLMLFNVVHGEQVWTLRGHTEVVNCCQFDDKKIISGSGDGTLKIWHTVLGVELNTLVGHTGEVYCLVYNHDIIASGSSDSSVILWTHTGKQLAVLNEHIGVVRCLYIDDYKLVSGGDRKKIVVWDWKERKVFNAIHRHPTLLHTMCVLETKIITASPAKPGTVTVMSYW